MSYVVYLMYWYQFSTLLTTHHSPHTHTSLPPHTHSRNDAKTVNVVSTACFSPISRIVSTALKFFLSGDEGADDEGAESSGSEVSEGGV